MDTTTTTGHVVVGVDGSAPGHRALVWACHEALRMGRPLHLVHAYAVEGAYAGGGAFTALSQSDLDWICRGAQATLDEAVAQAAELAPGVPTTSELCSASPGAALVRTSRGAHCVVLGARGRTAVVAALLGSVSAQVVAHAAAPTVVVHDREDPRRRRDGVVVGVDGSAASHAALAFAVEEARSRHTALEVVHAWLPDHPHRLPRTRDAATPLHAQRARHELLVRETVADWATTHPDVEVVQSVVEQPTVDALVEHADGAELLVVGSRGRGGFTGLLLGSVSHGVLQRAGGPVAVVRA